MAVGNERSACVMTYREYPRECGENDEDDAGDDAVEEVVREERRGENTNDPQSNEHGDDDHLNQIDPGELQSRGKRCGQESGAISFTYDEDGETDVLEDEDEKEEEKDQRDDGCNV